ncbi:hypothetical protein CHS0354_032116 [Potamilus streckersoni]|uniref:RING-type domain-containing protein n=1 Tax=Potamilus streckersoni TaxID=2493646 RepID=A0AAE0TAI0_9BIVA|nr:hypothetical protein CHS0354_032116 [Potamilus streckersoni]
MGNNNSMFSKFQKICHRCKRKKKSIAVFCSNEGNPNYFECLSSQNGVLGHPDTCSFCSYVSKQVRGEKVLEQNLSYDDNKVKDYQHVHTELKSVGRTILSNQKESVHDTFQKLSFKCGLKPQMPRTMVGSCHESDWSNNVTKTHENINSGKEESNVKCEYKSVICYSEISENDSGIESLLDTLDLQDSLDMDKKRFAAYWNTKGSMGYFSQENLNSVTSDDADSNPGIVPEYGMQSRDGSTTPGTVNSTGSYTSSHRYCSFSCSTRNDDCFISEGYRGSFPGSVQFSAEHQNSGPSDVRLGIVYETSKKDELVFNDAVPNKGKTGPEPFVESSHSEWDIEEDYVLGENNESISCIQSINASQDPDTCLDVTADKFKKDGDDDSSQDGYKKHHHVLTGDSKDHSTQVSSAENTTSCQMFNTLDEETSIYNQNEPQSVSISQHLNPCITKLGIVQMHGRMIPFKLESISKTEPSLSLRESNLTFSSHSFNEEGIKKAIIEMSMKQSKASEQPQRLYSSSVQSQHDRIPVSELGIAERNPYFQLGALDRLSSDDNVFKQRSGLRWIFRYGFVLQGSVLRLQHWLRHHQMYPFTNIKDFWTSLSTDSPPKLEECMSVEWMRYQSFQNYPVSAYGSTSRLARDGFYYTGQGTQTRCFSCSITHSDWNRTDNPHEVHQRLSPNCPFLNGRQERYPNIPMSLDGNVAEQIGTQADRDSMPLPSLPVTPLSGSSTNQSQAEGRRSEYREGSGATKTVNEDDTTGQQQNLGSGETTPGVPSHPVEESAQSEANNRPKFPEKVSLPSRIATFSHGWPPYLDQTPQQMAEAGFFFTGSQDYTRCYQCGGGLRNWEPGDNPWIEHCRWYPMCPHVQKGKGQRFVNAVLKKQAELLANQRADSRMKAQYGSGSTDPLETLAAITLLEMGYPRDTVRNSILILRSQKGSGVEINAQEVLDFIWKEENIERQRQYEEASRPYRQGGPQPPALPTLMEHLNLDGSPAATQTGMMQSASNVTTTSSIATAIMTVTSDTMATNSTLGLTSMSTSASGSTQNSHASGQEQKPEENQGYKTAVGGAGDKRKGSMTRDGVSEASVKADGHAQNHEVSKQEQQRPIGAIGGHQEEPGANAHAIAEAIEDEEFHSLDSEEMENKDPVELEEENKRLKEQTTCKICMENPIRVIFIPCGHLVCCETCAPAFRKCPICRKRIQQAIKTFL